MWDLGARSVLLYALYIVGLLQKEFNYVNEVQSL